MVDELNEPKSPRGKLAQLQRRRNQPFVTRPVDPSNIVSVKATQLTIAEVSLVKVHGRPARLVVESKNKNYLERTGAYIDPFKPFTGQADLPLTPESVSRLYSVYGDEAVHLSEDVVNWLRTEISNRRLLDSMLHGETTTIVDPAIRELLYEHQQRGVDFIVSTQVLKGNNDGIRVLEADDPRLGKTVQTCVGVLNDPDNTPALVVCLRSLVDYWVQALGEWTSGTVIKLEGSINDRLEELQDLLNSGVKFIAVTNWEFLRQIRKLPRRVANKIVTVVGDEAHIARNPKSQVAEGLHYLRPRNAVLLTATPLERGPQDYYSYLKFLRPHEFSSYWRFVGLFCETEHNGFGHTVVGARNQELLKDLLYPMVLRRRASEVASVPPKVFEEIPIELSKEFLDVYEHVRKTGFESLEPTIAAKTFATDNELLHNVLTQMTRLRQLSASPKLLGLNDLNPPKLSALLSIVERRYEEQKIVVFCSFVDVLKELEVMIPDSMYFTGSFDQVEAFSRPGGPRVFLTTPFKGGAGLSLSASSIIIYYDLPLSSTVLRQSMERTTLLEKQEPQIIVTLLATPMDHAISKLLQDKLETITDVDILTSAFLAETVRAKL